MKTSKRAVWRAYDGYQQGSPYGAVPQGLLECEFVHVINPSIIGSSGSAVWLCGSMRSLL
jgi:hypothetical protein